MCEMKRQKINKVIYRSWKEFKNLEGHVAQIVNLSQNKKLFKQISFEF